MAVGDEESHDERPAHHEHESGCVEWCPICRTMDVLRASATPEAREQWQAVQREAVLTLRALVDRYAQRTSDAGEPEPAAEPRRGEQPVRATPLEEIPPVE